LFGAGVKSVSVEDVGVKINVGLSFAGKLLNVGLD